MSSLAAEKLKEVNEGLLKQIRALSEWLSNGSSGEKY